MFFRCSQSRAPPAGEPAGLLVRAPDVVLSHVDEAVLRGLYHDHAGALLRHVLPLTAGDRGRAEDLVQETLLRAWQHPEAIRPERGPV